MQSERSLFTFLGHPRFFLGSDSAPHPLHTKSTSTPSSACAAGVYTSPILLPLVAHLLEDFGALDRLEGFVSMNGRAFYKMPIGPQDVETKTVLRKVDGNKVADSWGLGGESVVSFWAGKKLRWEKVVD